MSAYVIERDPPASKAKNRAKSGKPDRFAPIWLDDIGVDTEPAYLIDGLMPAGPSFGVIFGPPKSLKSFVLKDALLHVAMGRPYGGREVLPGAVIYVTSEGVLGVKRRLIAMRRHHDIEGLHVPFALVPAMPDLGAGTADLEELKTAIGSTLKQLGDVPLRAVAIDTLRRAIPGKSENEQKDMSVFVANCDALATAFGCHVPAVHHSPRSDDGRTSGTNSLEGALDCGWSVGRDNGTSRATVTLARMKDGEEGDTWSVELRPLDIGTDRTGRPITTCYVELTDPPARRETRSAPAKAPTLTATERAFFDILDRAIAEAGEYSAPGLPPSARAVTRDMLKSYCRTAGLWNESTPDAQRTKFNTRLETLAGKHTIARTAEHVCITRRPK
jgi:AAA domain-containing protein